MCYLITSNPNETIEVETLAEARKTAEAIAHNGASNVRVWLLTHSVEIVPQAVWADHAKGLSGAKE